MTGTREKQEVAEHIALTVLWTSFDNEAGFEDAQKFISSYAILSEDREFKDMLPDSVISIVDVPEETEIQGFDKLWWWTSCSEWLARQPWGIALLDLFLNTVFDIGVPVLRDHFLPPFTRRNVGLLTLFVWSIERCLPALDLERVRSLPLALQLFLFLHWSVTLKLCREIDWRAHR